MATTLSHGMPLFLYLPGIGGSLTWIKWSRAQGDLHRTRAGAGSAPSPDRFGSSIAAGVTR